jgi:hypothetical protein
MVLSSSQEESSPPITVAHVQLGSTNTTCPVPIFDYILVESYTANMVLGGGQVGSSPPTKVAHAQLESSIATCPVILSILFGEILPHTADMVLSGSQIEISLPIIVT